LQLLEPLHHLPELGVLLEKPVHLGHAGAAPPRDAGPTTAIDDRRIAPLPGRHGADDRLEAMELLLLTLELLGQASAALEERHHVEQLPERAHGAKLLELRGEVFQRESVVADL